VSSKEKTLGYHLNTLYSKTREPLLKGRLSTIDLLVQTSSGELLFLMKTIFIFNSKEPTLNLRAGRKLK
jgi:hypothetical protein